MAVAALCAAQITARSRAHARNYFVMTTQQKEIARRLIVEAIFQRRLAAKIGLNVFGSIMAMRYASYVGAAKLVCNPARTVNDNNVFDRFAETLKCKQT